MNDFNTELKALLQKYNATIGWGCSPCSDTHGVYEEYMEIYDEKGNTILKVEGRYIDADDIEEYDFGEAIDFSGIAND